MSSAASRVFEHYESEYLAATREAAVSIENVHELLPGVERNKVTSAAEKSIDAAVDIVQQMELEARSSGGSARADLIAQAKDYKEGINKLRLALKQSKMENRADQTAREQLLSKSNPEQRKEAENQHSRLLATTERMTRTNDKLKGAIQIATETEAVGASIIGDLEVQRHTIEHARSNLRGASAGLERSKFLLAGMGRRAVMTRILMWCIVSSLCCLIILVVWLNWFWHAEVAAAPPPSPSPAHPPPL